MGKKSPRKTNDPRSRLTPKKAKIMVDCAREGKTTTEIAEILEVTRKTLYNWQNYDEQLRLDYRKAKSDADELIEASLFQRAKGFTHESTKVFFDSKSLTTIEHKVAEYFPPDAGAQKFWLSNRQPKRWRDKTEVEHSGKIGEGDISDENLDALINEKLTKLLGKDD